MKKYRITLTHKQLKIIDELLHLEFEQLYKANAAQSSKDFIGRILDTIYLKLNP